MFYFRCAKRTLKDKVSSPKEEDHFANLMHVNKYSPALSLSASPKMYSEFSPATSFDEKSLSPNNYLHNYKFSSTVITPDNISENLENYSTEYDNFSNNNISPAEKTFRTLIECQHKTKYSVSPDMDSTINNHFSSNNTVETQTFTDTLLNPISNRNITPSPVNNELKSFSPFDNNYTKLTNSIRNSHTPIIETQQEAKYSFSPNSGLFDDILSSTGKVLSTITVDKIHSSTVCDITDVPIPDDIAAIERDAFYSERISPNKIHDTFRTETYTNEDILRIKLEPTLSELDDFILNRLTPEQPLLRKPKTPTYADQNLNVDNYKTFQAFSTTKSSESLLANYLYNEHLSDVSNNNIAKEYVITTAVEKDEKDNSFTNDISSSVIVDKKEDSPFISKVDENSTCSKSTVRKVWNNIKNIPVHYHAIILCLFLILYNIFYNLYKQKVLDNSKETIK